MPHGVILTMSTLSGVLFFAAYLPYLWAIVNHQTVPSPVSWAIWASDETLALLAMKKEKSLNGQIVGAVVGAWIVTVLALIFGKPVIGPVECICIATAVLGIVLWQKTGNAVLAIICYQIAVFAGAIPTIVNGYQTPSREDPVAWSIWFASCICALLAIRKEKWTLSNALQPLTFTTIESIMVILVVIRPHV